MMAGLLILPAVSLAQVDAPDQPPGHAPHAAHAGHPVSPAAAWPVQGGQSAFAAIQEIVEHLLADPATDWRKVDIAALRTHLVDMDELVLRARADVKPIAGGVEIMVTAEGRTREAIQRMVPAHAKELAKRDRWRASAERTPAGVRLTVTGEEPQAAVQIRALGFFGLMATGAHHQAHHLGIAKGVKVH